MTWLIKKLKANFRLIIQELKKYKKHGSELIGGEKFVNAHEGIIIPVIVHCRTPGSCQFERFKVCNEIDCKEQTVLESIKDAYEGENMQPQYSVLGYKIDLYFHEYKLAIEADELGHNDRNIDYQIQRQKPIEKELGCVFIRINPEEENINIFKAMNEIHRHIKKSTKKSLIDKTSKRLSELEKSNHPIITNALKRVLKKILPSL